MKRLLDLDTWNRREHFAFFSRMEEPYWGATVNVDVTTAYAYCKSQNHSFFLYYLYQSLLAANAIECFRYRIIEGQVFIYDNISASATVNRPDGTFDFTLMPYAADFQSFSKMAQLEIARVKTSEGLSHDISGHDVIHYSSLPWLRFTGLSHARSFSYPDSCPKISFGQLFLEKKRRIMPVSIHVHHGLVDGLHVGQFVAHFQKLLDITLFD